MEHYTNIFVYQRPMNKLEKWLVVIMITILMLFSICYFLTADERAVQEAIIIDNFNTAIDLLLKKPQLDLSVTKIFTGDQLMGAGRISQHVWYITTNMENDEHLGYYYGFRINRTLSHPNYVDWHCMSQYHPINKKLNPNNIINYLDYNADITDKNLSKWPKLSHTQLLYFRDREKLVDLIKKVQQQTAYLFK